MKKQWNIIRSVLDDGDVPLHLEDQVAQHLAQDGVVLCAVLEGVQLLLVAALTLHPEVDVQVLYTRLVGQELRVSCQLAPVVHPDVLTQPRDQVLHVLELEVFGDGLGVDLRLQGDTRALALGVVGELFVGDAGVEVEVVVVDAHEVQLLAVVLLHHFAVDRALLLCYAHLRPLLEEFAGLGVAQREVGAAELEVAPDLEVLELEHPGCGEGLADEGDHLGPLAKVGFEFDHQDEVDGDVFLQLQSQENVQHPPAQLLSAFVAAVDGVQVHPDVHQHQFHRNRVLVGVQQPFKRSQQFLAVTAPVLQFLDQQGQGIVPKAVPFPRVHLLEPLLHAEAEALPEQVAVVACAVAHQALEFSHDGAVALQGAVEQVGDDLRGLPVEFADGGGQAHGVELHQVAEEVVAAVAGARLGLRFDEVGAFERRAVEGPVLDGLPRLGLLYDD